MNAKTKKISKLIRANINQIDPVADVVLYGSRARGDSREDSDWDVLVLTNYPVDLKKESEFRDNLYELELETGEPFSVFVYSKNDWKTKYHFSSFYHNVIEEGISI
jgi:predicted nucleotidyltransferase